MRNLLFVCVLAGVSVACRDALSPRDAAGAALSEASQRAHLDLREERASLIAAGNAVSAAIQQQGVAAALGDAFAEDVVFLGARTNTIQGRAGAVDWLTSNPLAPSAIAWSVLVADVSNDGTQGYTWTTGTFTADFGTGPTEFPGVFLLYWRRAGGEWEIAAMVFQVGGPPNDPVPSGFGTPTTKHRRNFPSTDVAAQRQAIIAADAAFSAGSVSNGSGPAFERFAAPNAIALSGDFVFGPEAIGQAFASAPGDVVSWVPRFADVAASGDLGFTVGDASFDLAQSPDFFSKYLTIWQKQNTGEWLYVADLGNSRPAP